jgi:hypothetical protein
MKTSLQLLTVGLILLLHSTCGGDQSTEQQPPKEYPTNFPPPDASVPDAPPKKHGFDDTPIERQHGRDFPTNALPPEVK